jgi:signal transduction histidine kinase
MSYGAGERQQPAYPAYPGSADSRPPRPPLTKRMRAGHWVAIDCAVGVLAAFSSAAAISQRLPVGQVRFPLVLLFMAVVFLPVALRRRAPAIAFGALVITGVLLAGVSPKVTAAIFLAAVYVLYTVTVEGRRRTGAAALILVLTAMLALGITAGRHGRPGSPDGDGGIFVPVALACVIAWMTGYSVRQRRRYVVTLQQQAANSAVAQERLRIARELHDVVAHSMSVIAVQAGYGQYVMDTSPDGARDALGAIQATSRDALEEMRRMLGVLRQQDADPGPAGADDTTRPGPGSATTADRVPAASEAVTAGGTKGGSSRASRAPLAPAPGLAGLDRLVARTCGAGVRVALEVSGQPRPAPAGVDLSAYRIIQEALTNVVRHAGTGAACLVRVRYTDADLVIRVTDDGCLPAGSGLGGHLSAGPMSASAARAGIAAAGTGHGIIGMRERVNLCGGSFSAGPLTSGGFEVTAALPLPMVSPGASPWLATEPVAAAGTTRAVTGRADLAFAPAAGGTGAAAQANQAYAPTPGGTLVAGTAGDGRPADAHATEVVAAGSASRAERGSRR